MGSLLGKPLQSDVIQYNCNCNKVFHVVVQFVCDTGVNSITVHVTQYGLHYIQRPLALFIYVNIETPLSRMKSITNKHTIELIHF